MGPALQQVEYGSCSGFRVIYVSGLGFRILIKIAPDSDVYNAKPNGFAMLRHVPSPLNPKPPLTLAVLMQVIPSPIY